MPRKSLCSSFFVLTAFTSKLCSVAKYAFLVSCIMWQLQTKYQPAWCKYTFNPLDNLYRYGFIRIMLTKVTVLSLFLPCAFPLRCYTDIPATKVWKLRWEIVILTNLVNLQSLSVECGMNTGCLKIFKKAEQFDEYGTFIPPHRRGEDTQLFRGDLSYQSHHGKIFLKKFFKLYQIFLFLGLNDHYFYFSSTWL